MFRALLHIPDEINAQVDAELDEELVHLAKIGGVAVRVENSGSCHGVANVHAHYLGAAARRKLQNFHVLAMRKRTQEQKPRQLVLHHLVRCWVRREERQLRSHG